MTSDRHQGTCLVVHLGHLMCASSDLPDWDDPAFSKKRKKGEMAAAACTQNAELSGDLWHASEWCCGTFFWCRKGVRANMAFCSAHEMLCDQTWIKKGWESEHGVLLHRESCVTQPDSRKAVNANMWLFLIQKCCVARPGPKKASRAKLGLSGRGTCWVTKPGSKKS